MADQFGFYAVTIICVMLLHQVVSYFLEHNHFNYIHESGLGIILGAIVGVGALKIDGEFQLDFSKNLFFYVLIPILFYAEAYTMQKRFFFKYFLYINFFGVIGTFFNVVLIYLLTAILNDQGYIIADGNVIRLTGAQIMEFSIIISSLESVVGKSLVNGTYRPKLHSVLFGEELMNEVTVYSLFVSFETIIPQLNRDEELTPIQYGQFVGAAIVQFILASLVGVVIGVFFTWLSKYLVGLMKSEVAVTSYVIYVGYLSFSVAKVLHLPGAVTIFIVGLIFSHYLSYNMPQRCLEASRNNLRLMSYLSEAFIFLLLGISLSIIFFSHPENSVPPKHNIVISWTFIAAELVIIFVTRIICFFLMVALIFLFRLKNSKTFRFSIYDLVVICISGLIRGAVAFALIQYITQEVHSYALDKETIDQLYVIRTGVIILVISTNLIFGIFLPYIAKLCFEKMKAFDFDEEKQSIRRQSITCLFGDDVEVKKLKIDRKTSRVKLFLKRFDDNVVKTLMIFDYKNRIGDILKQKKQQNKCTNKKNQESGHHKRHNSDETHEVNINQVEPLGHHVKVERKSLHKFNQQKNVQAKIYENHDELFKLDGSQFQTMENNLTMELELKQIDERERDL